MKPAFFEKLRHSIATSRAPSIASWDFFDEVLEKANVVGAPGAGFGPSGEGYFRLTGFGRKEQTQQAVERIKQRLSR